MGNSPTNARRGTFAFWTGMQLWKQIFIALTLGLLFGVLLNQTGNADVAKSIKPVGDLFIRGIKMLIVPLIFVSLVTGVASLRDLSTMGRLSLKTIALYLTVKKQRRSRQAPPSQRKAIFEERAAQASPHGFRPLPGFCGANIDGASDAADAIFIIRGGCRQQP